MASHCLTSEHVLLTRMHHHAMQERSPDDADGVADDVADGVERNRSHQVSWVW